jgi:hypothetical protein
MKRAPYTYHFEELSQKHMLTAQIRWSVCSVILNANVLNSDRLQQIMLKRNFCCPEK